jgi:2-polyprenyl-6-methoxyphenol hydroxylase-like FAD-dependent oxidoreductase
MRVLICGGGVAGLTLALCLERQGHQPVVIEKAPHLRSEGYMLSFCGAGYDASERLSLLPVLERIHYPIPRLAFVDEQGHEQLSLPYPLLRKRLFNDRHFTFMRGELVRALMSQVEGKAELRFSTTVEAIEQHEDHVRVRLSGGSMEDFELLVGADGVHSRVRQLVFGPEERFERFLGSYAAVFIMDNPPAGLFTPDAFLALTVVNRGVSVYPIRGGRAAALFIYRAERPVEDFSRESILRELRAAYSGLGWIVPSLLEHAAQAESLYFDKMMQIELPQWSTGRVVLVGDAAQCLSLLAVQGAAMGMAGAYVLAEELAAAGGEVGAAMSRYEQRLKPVIKDQQAAARRIASWTVPTNAFRQALREPGLRMSLWPMISAFIRQRLLGKSVFAEDRPAGPVPPPRARALSGAG